MMTADTRPKSLSRVMVSIVPLRGMRTVEPVKPVAPPVAVIATPLELKSPPQKWTAHLYALALLVSGCIVYYVSERWSVYWYVHMWGLYVYLFTGEAVNLFFGLLVLPKLPADVWDALHSPENDHGMSKRRRRFLRGCCAAFGVATAAAAMLWFDLTTRSDHIIIHNCYPIVFGLSGVAGNVFFYLYIIRHFPHKLRVAISKPEVAGNDQPVANSRIPWNRKLIVGFWANMCGLVLMLLGIGLFWISESWYTEKDHPDYDRFLNRFMYSLDALVFFCTGSASNIFFALWVLPRLPDGMWDALHAGDEDNDEDELLPGVDKVALKKRRALLRWYCYIFGIVLGILAVGWYQLTTTTNIFVLRRMFPLTYWASCFGAAVFFWLRILKYFPPEVRKLVHRLDALDPH
jgi:hypothetical protein